MGTSFLDRLGLSRREDIEETIAGSTPLLAAVGAGDLALERLRAARTELAHRAASFDPKAFREQAQASLVDGVDALQTEMMAAPEQLKALPERAQEWPTRAQSLMADLVSAAFSTYGELAVRGQTVLSHVHSGADFDGGAGEDGGSGEDAGSDGYADEGDLPLTRPTAAAADLDPQSGVPDVDPVSRAGAVDVDPIPQPVVLDVDGPVMPDDTPAPESSAPAAAKPARKPRTRKTAMSPAKPVADPATPPGDDAPVP